MTPVEQRQMALFDEHGDSLQRGDCLSAAIASVFELPLDEVPFFVESDNWWQEYNDWLNQRGMCLRTAQITLDETDPTRLTGWPGDVYWIGCVKSPRGKARCSVCKGERETRSQWNSERGDYDEFDEPQPCSYCEATGLVPSLHAVVMYGREIVWDPHPQREMGHLGFVSGEHFGVVDPARLQLKEAA